MEGEALQTLNLTTRQAQLVREALAMVAWPGHEVRNIAPVIEQLETLAAPPPAPPAEA